MRVGIVGAGIIGLSVARRLGQVLPDVELTVLDKEAAPGLHQTGHSSGVAHAGLYYAPGSWKARLCRRGIGLLEAFCAEHGVAYQACGKLVVARSQGEVARLEELERRARSNGVQGLRRLAAGELEDVEPFVRGVAGLHSPSTAIVDFGGVVDALAGEVARKGGRIVLGFTVAGFRRVAGETRLRSVVGEELAFDRVVVCAGLQADRLARLAGAERDPAIVPFRGEYLRLVPERAGLVRGLIYPVPDPALPFLGVHFTRRVDGTVDIGPNAVLAFAREGYRWGAVSIADLRETLAYPGFRRMARRHWRTGIGEVYGSLSRRAFVARARTFVPDLRVADVVGAPAGVRAQAIDPDGSLVDDFRIASRPGIVMIRNAPSPAATSSLAIAEHVVDRLIDGAA